MRVLVIGSGGREHALSWRLSKDPNVKNVICAPGNPGMEQVGTCLPVHINDAEAVLRLIKEQAIDLTVVGPEAPLDAGVSDAVRAAGHPIVGPSQKAAQLECSKVFSKHFMARHGIPTARFVVHTELTGALDAVSGTQFGFPVVVKADGLAGGKGVVVAQDRAEAEAAVRACMADGAFGAAGSTLVIEECLTGPEVSFFVLCDGTRAISLGSAQDHKRAYDGDKGPNTGGMGAFAPSPLMTPALQEVAMHDIAQRVIDGVKADGLGEYRGFLYISLMLTPDGPKVIEFNVRFGDPEAQALLPAINGPLAQVLLASANGTLDQAPPLSLSSDKFVGVILASGGYPGAMQFGKPITGLTDAAAVDGVVVFHAGTKRQGDHIVTSGGRVLAIVGRGATYEDAMARAYAGARSVSYDGMEFRTDIGRKALTT
ncbi:MAG: phosphoribosylamine--glycine ligase [Acidobacteria bacterium]|nr:phosphoribosylamine--glycine ligase [Acidobacteriota bacterium]